MVRWLVASIGLSLIALVPLALLTASAIAWRRRTRPWDGAAIPVMRWAAVPAVVIVLFVVALRPGDIVPGDPFAINLEPFRDLRMSLEGGHLIDIAVMNLAGNAAMFVPFGAVLAWVFPGSRVIVVALAALALSIVIEVAQSMPQFGRSSDVTDAIMNTAGAVLGFAIVRGAKRWSDGRGRSADVGQGSDPAPGPPVDHSAEIRAVAGPERVSVRPGSGQSM
jgi:hypothetical protein